MREIKMYKTASILILLLWGTVNFVLVYTGNFYILGGSAALFYCIPILLLLLIKYNHYQKSILQVILLSIGLITLNLYGYYAKLFHLKLHVAVSVIIAYFPFILVIAPFLTLLNVILKSDPDVEDDNERKNLANLRTMNALITVSFLPFGILIFVNLSNRETSEVIKALYIYLGSMILSLVFLNLVWRKAKNHEVHYFLKISEKIFLDNEKVKKWIIIGFPLFIMSSLFFEVNRGMWFLWIECLILIALMIIFLWKFYKHTFTVKIEVGQTSSFTVPQVISIKFFIIYVLGLTTLFLWVFLMEKLLGAILAH
ncbi:MAG: hypothetical protein WA126_12410 [Thermodesulfovibrionales bacterium]